MTALDDVLTAASLLQTDMNQIIDGLDDPWEQQQADWIWFRLSSIGVVLRDRGGGPLAAVLARGLLEQAAYWDWALATGVGRDLVARQTALELGRLRRLAASVDDSLWAEWLLPPGVTLNARGTEGLPRSAAEAIKRLGSGLDGTCLAPLRSSGVFAAYRLLELLTHGGIAASFVMRPGGGEEVSDPLAAAILQVSCAGAAASFIAQLDLPPSRRTALDELSTQVASAASVVHGLPVGGQDRRLQPASVGSMTPLTLTSRVGQMPVAAESTTAAGRVFLAAADDLVRIATSCVRTTDDGAWLVWPAFQMAWSQVQVLRGVLDGSLARALLPFAARPLFEEGGRWGWLGLRLAGGAAPGSGLHSIVDDGRRRVLGVRDALVAESLPRGHLDRLLGPATQLLEARPAADRLPAMRAMLSIAHPSGTGIDTANPMYSLLSQFVHSTPVAQLHLQRSEFASISAPMYAVAVEAACRGFHRTAISTLAVCCEPNRALGEAHLALTESLAGIIYEAMRWHFLG